jgi:hypothetical protein
MTIQERSENVKARFSKKLTKQEVFEGAFCPACKGEQFKKFTCDDGRVVDIFCPTCWGSGLHPRELTDKREFIFAR